MTKVFSFLTLTMLFAYESFGQCEAYFTAIAGENGYYSFDNNSVSNNMENTLFLWQFGDGTIADGALPVHQYEQSGTYEVCLFLTVMDGNMVTCGDTFCTTLEVTVASNCPDAIFSGAGGECGVMHFEIGSFVEGEAVTWFPGDETGAVETGHFFSHTYAQPGSYTVCAFYTSPACPNGVELCTEIVVESCNVNVCPETITVEYIEGFCYEIGFQAGEPNEDAVVDWYFENETVNDFGDFIWMGFNPDNSDAGNQNVCAFYTSPSCPNGIELCTEFFVCTPETACPDQIWSGAGVDCGVMHFEIGSFVEGEAVTWYPGDETGAVEGGHFFEHFYAEPGEYQVCAFYTSPLCPNGVELCTTIVVEACGTECPSVINGQALDCNSYIFNIVGVETGNVIWEFGDGSGEISSVYADHSYAENGVYIITAQYSGPGCPNGINIYYTINVQCETGTECPSEIWSGAGEGCGVMNFEIGSFVEGEAVTWYPGDETGAVETGHFFSHTYAEPGSYTVCAFYTSPACPNGVELCTNIVVENCNNCPTTIVYEYNCPDGTIAFHVANWPELAPINWVYNGQSISSDNNFIVLEIVEGPGYICAYSAGMEEEGCNQVCLEMNFQCNENTCPTEIWSGAGEDCGVMNFEIGNYVEGEAVTWYPGDETGAVETGHFFSHTYAEPGEYTVCAYYTSSNCPDGIELCTTIVVEACEPSCTDIIIGLDSYINNGGPSVAYWSIYSLDDISIDEGVSQYSEQDPYFDFSECLEDGCYVLVVEGLGVANTETFGIFITNNGESIVQSVEVANDNLVYIIFGVNSDCVVECTPSSLMFVSFTAGGGTPGVAYSLTNTTSNEIVASGQAEFNGDFQTYFTEMCLEDGCYSFQFDSSFPIAAGQGLEYQLLVDGENVLTEANVTYFDNYAMMFEFGINSDCSEPSCEASFEPIFTNTPGHIEFQNTSTYDGAAEWHWDYGNGVTSDGQSGNVWYESNGVYLVCLTITTEGCTDTYCESITVSNMETGCELNEVTITITSEYANENTFDMIELLFNVNDITIEGLDITAYEGTVVLTGCVPDGCYEVTAQAPEGMEITADAINITVDAGEASALLGLNIENNSVSAELGINSDCGDGVDEKALAMFVVYPNPANEILTVRSSDNQKIDRLEIVDASGRVVMSMNQTTQLNVAQLASGCYYVKVTTALNAAVLPLNIQH
ncbi:MAG: PKD domain-containing protein [Flavobacteriales bacterium]